MRYYSLCRMVGEPARAWSHEEALMSPLIVELAVTMAADPERAVVRGAHRAAVLPSRVGGRRGRRPTGGALRARQAV